MSTENKITQPDWTSLQGRTLEGGYELTTLLGAEEGRATFKVRVLGDHLLRAQVNMYQASSAAAEQQIELWDRARTFGHRNLSLPLATGTLSEGDLEIAYIVFQRPDETLGGVLGDRELDREEATDLLQNLISGLERLHSEGLVHGCVAPEQIFAIGNLVQLSTIPIRKADSAPSIETTKARYVAPESDGENTGAPADVWCLGATLFESLTQKFCGDGCREEAAKLPAPFSMVVQRCLHPDPATRVRLPEVLSLSKQRYAPQPVAKPIPTNETKPTDAATPIAPVRVPPPVAAPASASANTAPAVAYETKPEPTRPKPVLVPEARKPEIRSEPSLPPTQRPNAAPKEQEQTSWVERTSNPLVRAAIYAVVGLLIFFGLIWLVRPKRHVPMGPAQPQVSRNSPASRTSGSSNNSNAPKNWETRTLSPDGTSQKAGQAAQSPSTAAAPKQVARREVTPVVPPSVKPDASSRTTTNRKGSIWRVVAYTYARSQDAQNRAKVINDAHPDLKAEEFSPKANGGPYLVVLGGQLGSKEDAAQFRQKAISAGLPRDSYLQNFRQ